MRKPASAYAKTKGQISGNCATDQRLCFHYKESTIILFPKSVIPSPKPSSVAVQPGLCRIWSETPKTDFLATQLNLL